MPASAKPARETHVSRGLDLTWRLAARAARVRDDGMSVRGGGALATLLPAKQASLRCLTYTWQRRGEGGASLPGIHEGRRASLG
jgi:hypothetical protein